MIVINDTYISDDVADKFFVCHLDKCKGACCVEGDLGAPLEMEELLVIEDILDEVKPYLSVQGIEEIKKQGPYIKDWEGDFSTSTINNRECVFSIYDAGGVLKCGIEQAYLDGKISFRKPISCHLYPIRITKFDDKYETINYDRWSICSPACDYGAKLGVPLYKFLKDPLTRKYGENWYNELVLKIENPQ